MLYPQSRIGRGNLVLRHSVPTFRRVFRGTAFRVEEFNAGLSPWHQIKIQVF